MNGQSRRKVRLEEYIPSDFGRTWVISKDTGRRGTHVPKAFVDICGGYESDAKIFAQIMYWHLPNDDYESKLTQFHEGCWWLAKNHSDWFAETRTKRVTARKCIDRLRDEHHLIYVMTGGFAGSPVPLLRVNWQEFERRMKRWIDLQGEDVNEKAYPQFLAKLATPKPLAEAYVLMQNRYKDLSDKVLHPATQYPTHDIKYHTIDLKDQPPLIRRINPVIRRITSNTESPSKTIPRLLSYYVGEGRTPALGLSLHTRICQVKAKREMHRAASPPKPRIRVAAAFTPPPVPLPPSPPPAAAEQGSSMVQEPRDPYIVTGGDIPPTTHDQTAVPFHYRRSLEALTAEQAQAQLKQHPLWTAYAAAFPDGAQPDIDRWEVESIEVALKTLDDLRVTPEEVTKVMAAWLPQRKKTQKPHRFIYLPGDVRNWRQMHPTSAGGTPSHPETDALAADELATVEGCKRVIADPDRPPFLRKIAQEQLLRLTQPLVPDDYWPTPEAGESDEEYAARRDDLWTAVWQSGFGDQYLPSERPTLRMEAVP